MKAAFIFYSLTNPSVDEERERGIDLGTFEDEEEGDIYISIDGESDVELDGNDQLDLDLDSDLLSDRG